MNKVFLGLILAVCVLGMALVMLNDRLGRKAEPRPAAPAAETLSNEEMAINARAMELAEAAKALAPPKREDQPLTPATTPPSPFTTPATPAVAPVPAPKPTPLPPTAVTPPKVEKVEVPAPKPTPVKVEQPTPPPAAAKPEPPAQKPVPVKAEKPEQPKAEPPKSAPKSEPKAAEAPKGDAPKAESPKNSGAGKTANRFVVYARDKGATVRVGGNGKMEYSSLTLENPNRIVVDFSGEWKFPANLGIPKNELVSAVRVAQNGDKTRMVIDLKDKPRKVLLVPFKGGDGVDVRVDK